jgi:hypothetical protein
MPSGPRMSHAGRRHLTNRPGRAAAISKAVASGRKQEADNGAGVPAENPDAWGRMGFAWGRMGPHRASTGLARG